MQSLWEGTGRTEKVVPEANHEVPTFNAYNGATVIVTGSEGFIGRSLVSKLSALGADIITVDVNYPPCYNSAVHQHINANLAYLKTLPSADYVFHAAAWNQVLCEGNRALTQENVLATSGLLYYARALGLRLRKLVNISSASVYGNQEGQLTETSPCLPTTDYARSKLAGEVMLHNAGLPIVSLRLSNVYGPTMLFNSPHCGVVGKMIKAGLDDLPFYQTQDSGTTRTYTHIDTVVEAALRAGVSVLNDTFLNVADYTTKTLKDLSANVSDYLYKHRKVFLYSRLKDRRPTDTITYRHVNCDAMEDLLGVRPKESMDFIGMITACET